AVLANGSNTATSNALAISIGLIGAGAGESAYAEVTNEANVEALVGATSVMTVPGAPVSVLATSNNTASANAPGGAGSGLISVVEMLPTAKVGGGTKAEFDGTLVGASLDVEALGENSATASLVVVSIGLLGSGAGADADAEITSDANVEAAIGSAASVT